MEKYKGRALLPTEIVHHINFNKSDNRIENLMLFSSQKEHTNYHRKIGKDKTGFPINPTEEEIIELCKSL